MSGCLARRPLSILMRRRVPGVACDGWSIRRRMDGSLRVFDDWYLGPPRRCSKEVLNHFGSLGQTRQRPSRLSSCLMGNYVHFTPPKLIFESIKPAPNSDTTLLLIWTREWPAPPHGLGRPIYSRPK